MTAPDLGKVLCEVSAQARRADALAMRSPDYPAHEAGAVMEALSGARLDHLRAYELGPERAGAVHFSKSIVVLSSMPGARHALTIGMADNLDDLRAPGSARESNGYDPARWVCLRCQQPFESNWRGHRVCGACGPLMTEEPYAPRPRADRPGSHQVAPNQRPGVAPAFPGSRAREQREQPPAAPCRRSPLAPPLRPGFPSQFGSNFGLNFPAIYRRGQRLSVGYTGLIGYPYGSA